MNKASKNTSRFLSADVFQGLNIFREDGLGTQRDFAARTGMSLGKANGMLRRFLANGWLGDEGKLSACGMVAFALHKISR